MDIQDSTSNSDWRALYPFRSKFIEIAGGRLHYVNEFTGAESPAGNLLFVHGNPTWSFHWRQLISKFRDRFRCVAPDHLGCGLSDVSGRVFRLADRIDHLVALIERLDLTGVTLVAQDWGGAIGLGAALARPGRFAQLVLFNTGAFRPWFIPWRIRVCRTPLLGKLAVQGGNLFCRAALRMTLARTRYLPQPLAAGYLAPYRTWSRRRAVYDFVEDIPRSAKHPTWQTLGQIEDKLPQLADRPALLVWGMQDWCFTPACLDKFVELLPSAEVHRIADAGHWVVEDAPEEVLDCVSRFLTQSPHD